MAFGKGQARFWRFGKNTQSGLLEQIAIGARPGQVRRHPVRLASHKDTVVQGAIDDLGVVDFAQARTMMVDTQVRPNDVTIYPIIAAMLDVPREAFVPDARQAVAFMGENVRLSDERWLLEPRNFAKLLEAQLSQREAIAELQLAAQRDAAVSAGRAKAGEI